MKQPPSEEMFTKQELEKALSDSFIAGRSLRSFESFRKDWFKQVNIKCESQREEGKDEETVFAKIRNKLTPAFNLATMVKNAGSGPIMNSLKEDEADRVISNMKDITELLNQAEILVDELETHREELITKLMNAEDKLKELEPSEVKEMLDQLVYKGSHSSAHLDDPYASIDLNKEEWNKLCNLNSKLKELDKSDQEALAKAWEEAIREFILINILDMNYYERPKNPYTKD